MDQHPLQTCLQMEYLLTYHPLHQLTGRKAGCTYGLHWHHLHQMQEQCVRFRYHLLRLHRYHIQHRKPSCAASRSMEQSSHIMAHIPWIPDPCLHKFPEPHSLLLIPFPLMHVQYNRYSRLLPSLLRILHLGLRKVPGCLEGSMELWSMPEYKHLHLLPWNVLLQNALLRLYILELPRERKEGYRSVGSKELP